MIDSSNGTEGRHCHLSTPARSNLGSQAHWTLRLHRDEEIGPDDQSASPMGSALGRDITATVPGCVHTDLLAHGLISDPYLDQNEHELTWLWRTDAAYRGSFDGATALQCLDGDTLTVNHAIEQVDQQLRLDLVCDGLDTMARLQLNGVHLGNTHNQHRRYRFDVRSALAAAGNGLHQLNIDFENPLGAAERWSQELGFRPQMGNLSGLPFNAIRKMACNFGWDWGPTLTTSGIYQDIWLEAWRLARFDQVRPLASVQLDEGKSGTTGSAGHLGQVEINFALQFADDSFETRGIVATGDRVHVHSRAPRVGLRAEVIAPDGTLVVDTKIDCEGHTGVQKLRIEVPQVQLWWPLGYGDSPQSLTSVSQGAAVYHLRLSLLDEKGTVVGRHESDLGFRNVELVQEPDEYGSNFELRVNGQPVFVRGANWIPADCFPHRVTHELREHLIGESINANMNLLRVWGGGLYESDDFYQICNRRGVLVWQDFLFACAAYSEDDLLWNEVEAEARDNITRLSGHPSLVLWNGGNENIEGYHHWGWKVELPADTTWGRGYYMDLFPKLLAELDPTRPYVPSSPFTPSNEADPRNPHYGTVHHWEVWNSRDYTHYASFIPRFCAEFGFQGPANWGTIAQTMRTSFGGPLDPDHPVLLSHQKASDGQLKLQRGFEPHLPQPRDFVSWHWTTQLNQAHALTFALQHFRGYLPRCMGTIIWQLNDCWPVTSWAAIDGHYRRKPLWYAMRAVYKDHAYSLQPRGDRGALVLSLSNASPRDWSSAGSLWLLDANGAPVVEQPFAALVPGASSLEIELADTLTSAPQFAQQDAYALVIVGNDEAPCIHLSVPDKNFQLAKPTVKVHVKYSPRTEQKGVRLGSRAPGRNQLEVYLTANVLIKNLMLEPAFIHPELLVDDGWFDVLPGQSVKFVVYADSVSGQVALENLAASTETHLIQTFREWPVLRSANSLKYI